MTRADLIYLLRRVVAYILTIGAALVLVLEVRP